MIWCLDYVRSSANEFEKSLFIKSHRKSEAQKFLTVEEKKEKDQKKELRLVKSKNVLKMKKNFNVQALTNNIKDLTKLTELKNIELNDVTAQLKKKQNELNEILQRKKNGNYHRRVVTVDRNAFCSKTAQTSCSVRSSLIPSRSVSSTREKITDCSSSSVTCSIKKTAKSFALTKKIVLCGSANANVKNIQNKSIITRRAFKKISRPSPHVDLLPARRPRITRSGATVSSYGTQPNQTLTRNSGRWKRDCVNKRIVKKVVRSPKTETTEIKDSG